MGDGNPFELEGRLAGGGGGYLDLHRRGHPRPRALAVDRHPDRHNDAFEVARIATPEEIAEYLIALAAGLKRGEVMLESDDRALRLSPGTDIKLELKVKRKTKKGKIEIELGWKTSGAARAAPLQVHAGIRPH